ncbi:MAG: hypothetical protein R2725_01000 [Solirubrobacterales bacterium]
MVEITYEPETRLRRSRSMKLRPRLTYANVTATIALFLALGGGAAFAASKITAKDIAAGAVTTKKIKKRAVKSGKLAVGAVRGNQVADHALGSTQIAPGSIKPESLEVPLSFVASFGGGSANVPSGEPVAYPLDDATWTQQPGQINVVFGGAQATLAAEGATCQVYLQLLQNGEEVGGGQLSTDSETPIAVEGSLGANPQVDPVATKTNTLTAVVGSNGNCAAGSQVDSTRFRVLAFG